MLQLRVGIILSTTCNPHKGKAVGYFSTKGLLFVVWFVLFVWLTIRNTLLAQISYKQKFV